jgi:hypothetical protein
MEARQLDLFTDPRHDFAESVAATFFAAGANAVQSGHPNFSWPPRIAMSVVPQMREQLAEEIRNSLA